MHDTRPAPPPLAERLLAWRLPDEEREFVLGDLTEAFHAMVAGGAGGPAARQWYWRETLALLVARFPLTASALPPRRQDPPVQTLLSDLRLALRTLRRARGYALLCVLTLAVGIGGATALFSIVSPVLLQAPPYPEPDRLAFVWEHGPDGTTSNLGYATAVDLGRDAQSLASWSVLSYWQPTLQLEGGARLLNGQRVSAAYFRTLGVRPMLGRDFRPEEDVRGANQVVILSHGLWQRAWSGDSGVVGRRVTISGRDYIVAGVMPPSFENVTLPGAELWGPLGYDESLPWACRTCRHLRFLARLHPDVTREAARTELDQLMADLRQRFPGQYASVGSAVQDLRDATIGTLRPMMLMLGGAVVFLLLIACANVANLVLGRAFERQGEYALRRALGASGGRLVRQVTAETLVLAVAGGAAGLALAALGMRLLPPGATASLPRTGVGQLDWPVVAFAAGAALATTVLAGVIPALLALRSNVARALGEVGRRVVGRRRHRVRTTLVVVEVSLAIVLLTGAGLLLRTLDRLLRVRTGYDPSGVATLAVAVGGPRFAEEGPLAAYYAAVLATSQALPGVTGAALVNQLPLGGNFDAYGIHRVDRPSANPESDPSAQRFAVTPSYLEVMRIAILAGRRFTAADRAGAPNVAIINRALAELAFPGEDPIGKQIRGGGGDSPARTIVGVADDVRHLSLDGEVEPQLYIPFDQWGIENGMTLVVRTEGDPRTLLPLLRQRVQAVERAAALSNEATMRDVVANSASERQLALGALGVFALVALVLSAAGLYGVISASVAERRQEIGVRAALGATRGRIVGLVARQAALVTGVGFVVGTLGAMATGSTLRSLLYGVAPWDVPTLAGVVAVLALVAVVACAAPAWRAARVDPARVLRGE